MAWDQLDTYIYYIGHQLMPVRGDGFCFLNAIDMELYCDHNAVVTFDSLASTILGHLVANIRYYEWLHAVDVLKDADDYFKFGACGTLM